MAFGSIKINDPASPIDSFWRGEPVQTVTKRVGFADDFIYFSYLRCMKGIMIKLIAINMAFIFLSHVTGIRISEHNCFECGTEHVEIGGHLHTLHLIASLNQEHSRCCDPFHHQHEEHSKTCSQRFLGYTVPYNIMDLSKVYHLNPFSFVIQEVNIFQILSEKYSVFPSIIEHPVSANILLKTCQFLF